MQNVKGSKYLGPLQQVDGNENIRPRGNCCWLLGYGNEKTKKLEQQWSKKIGLSEEWL